MSVSMRLLLSSDPMEGGVSPELLQDVKVESEGLLEQLAALCETFHVALMGGSPEAIGEGEVNALFRNLHTLKGLAGIAGLDALVACLHAVEDDIDLVRNGQSQLSLQDVENLTDVQALCEDIFKKLPNPMGPDLEDVALQLGAAFSARADEARQKGPAEASGGTPAEGGLPPLSESEHLALTKAFQRSENLMGVVLPVDQFPSLEAVHSSVMWDEIGRCADVHFERVGQGPHAGALVLTSDLDPEVMGAMVDKICVALPRGFEGLWQTLAEVCGEAWAAMGSAVSLDGGSHLSASAPTASHPSRGATTPQQNFLAEVQAAQMSAPPNQGHGGGGLEGSGEDEHEGEDFDAQNTGGGQSELDPEMLQDFLVNAEELLENLSNSMLELESNPQNKNAIEDIFRNAHTIKGTAGMFGFRAIERLTHIMENLFDRIRKGTLSVSPPLMDALLFAFDRVKSMFESIKKGGSSELPINDAIGKLKSGEKGTGAAPTHKKNADAAPSVTANRAHSAVQESKSAPSALSPPAASSPPAAPPPASGGQPVDAKKEEKKEKESHGGEQGGSIRVDLRRLDSLVNLVGELVIDRTRFARIEEELRNLNSNSELCHMMSESVLLFGRHMNEVQSIIMKIRMVPISNAFNKFTRVVRDLARQLNKEIELQIEGGETELDKTLVEEIGDPLVHLIRNSADHGIEMPDDREKQNKARRGNIRLSAYQDGNMIVISVGDDGKGLQTQRIRTKGIERGLIKETDVLTDKEVFSLIFEPGFSTAEQVTNVSGRGVGMDVVKKNIVKLKGIIEIDSTPGKGTTITIKLPLTLAIIPSLMVEVLGESYAIPLVNVIESIRIKPEEVQRIGAADFVRLRDRVLPLLKLVDVFQLQQMEDRLWYTDSNIDRSHLDRSHSHPTGHGSASLSPPAASAAVSSAQTMPVSHFARRMQNRSQKPRLIFVVVGVGEKRVGIIVDQLLGQQEIVIKSLGRLLGKNHGIAGGCVLGNGRVALVLDVGEIIDSMGVMGRASGHMAPSAQPNAGGRVA